MDAKKTDGSGGSGSGGSNSSTGGVPPSIPEPASKHGIDPYKHVIERMQVKGNDIETLWATMREIKRMGTHTNPKYRSLKVTFTENSSLAKLFGKTSVSFEEMQTAIQSGRVYFGTQQASELHFAVTKTIMEEGDRILDVAKKQQEDLQKAPPEGANLIGHYTAIAIELDAKNAEWLALTGSDSLFKQDAEKARNLVTYLTQNQFDHAAGKGLVEERTRATRELEELEGKAKEGNCRCKKEGTASNEGKCEFLIKRNGVEEIYARVVGTTSGSSCDNFCKNWALQYRTQCRTGNDFQKILDDIAVKRKALTDINLRETTHHQKATGFEEARAKLLGEGYKPVPIPTPAPVPPAKTYDTTYATTTSTTSACNPKPAFFTVERAPSDAIWSFSPTGISLGGGKYQFNFSDCNSHYVHVWVGYNYYYQGNYGYPRQSATGSIELTQGQSRVINVGN